MNQKRETFIDLLHLFVLSGFALAQPLFDVLSNQAEFFVARRSEPADFILLAFVLCILIPAILALMELVVGLVSPLNRKRFHFTLVALLITLIFLPLLKRFEPSLSAGSIVFASAGLGVAMGYVYWKFHPARSFLTVLSVSILLFPGLFLFYSPVSKLLFSQQEQRGAVEVTSTTPVVLIVFDEFCVTSLLDERGAIDRVRYPNFAAFADDATWFRNATTISEVTNIVLPAILTGTYPTRRSLPHASDFPNNLFTLLGPSYDLDVVEPATGLCPDDLCEGGYERQKPYERMESLILDVAAVYPHLILPKSLARNLPSIAHTWGGFLQKEQLAFEEKMGEEISGDRVRKFLDFVETIREGIKPKLYFHHTLLPHAPYDYLPSGKKYAMGSWACGLLPNSEQWCEQEEPVIHAHQRYLLQVGYVDRLVGKLVQRLKKENLYDRALVILASDHGVSFIPGDNRRMLTETNFSDIMSVLLMIKKPYQLHGEVNDRHVESVDILPTIGEVLNVSIPWPVDGRAAFSPSWAPRTQKTVYTQTYVRHSVDVNALQKDLTLARQLKLFGSGNLTGPFPYLLSSDGIIGKRVEDLGPVGQNDLRVLFENKHIVDAFDPEADFVPCHLLATILADQAIERPMRLAVAVNGVIRAEADTYKHCGDKATLSAIVPDSSFRPGSNRIESFVVIPGRERVVLSRTNEKAESAYTLSRGDNGETITSSDGNSFPVIPGAIQGFLDVAAVEGPFVRLEGWAADTKTAELADLIILFSESSSIYSTWNNLNRPDVAQRFKNPALEASGFRFTVPLDAFEGKRVSVFAVSKEGKASELLCGDRARWAYEQEGKYEIAATSSNRGESPTPGFDEESSAKVSTSGSL